ncbi:MAG: MNIO family bufferin maturase [Burkholderiales bacterium]
MQPMPTPAKAVVRRAGVGWRAPHYRALLEQRPAVGFLEVHSENFFGAGGQPHQFLSRGRSLYPLSLHGVGLSLGSVDPLDRDHLASLRRLVARYEPIFVSEHLCWSSIGGRHLNELLPLPYTEEALEHVCSRVDELQTFLGRRILVENISSYLQFRHSTIAEPEFLTELSRRTGCGLLFDVNNVFVNAVNHGFDPAEYVEALPAQAIEEIHLAGYDEGEVCLVDTHGRPVQDEVWALYRHAIARLGPVPTLVEWDTEIPELAVLIAEAQKADAVMRDAIALAA